MIAPDPEPSPNVTAENEVDSAPVNADSASAIAQYRKALEARNIARRTLGLLILFIVVVYLYAFYWEARNFQENELEEFAEQVNSQLVPVLPQIQSSVVRSFERLTPVYAEAVTQELARSSPVFQDALVDALAALKTHTALRQPDIDAAFAGLVEAYVRGIDARLDPGIQGEERSAILTSARTLAETEVRAQLSAILQSPVDTASALLVKVERLAAREGLEGVEDPRFTLGLVLEVAGRQLQEATLEDTGGGQ